MTKRKLFAEVSEGFEALAEHREGLTTLRTVEGCLERIEGAVRVPAGGVRNSSKNLTVGLLSDGSKDEIQEGHAAET